VVHGIAVPPLEQYAPPEGSVTHPQLLTREPQAKGSLRSQGIAFGGIQDSTQVPPLHFPLQHSPAPVQASVFGVHAGPHTPSTHCSPTVQQVRVVPVPQTCAAGQHTPPHRSDLSGSG
jgi:hypothetical protein